MSIPDPYAAHLWKITRQVRQTLTRNAAGPRPGVRVYWQTAAGTTGSVWVPMARYDREGVRSFVSDAVNQAAATPAAAL